MARARSRRVQQRGVHLVIVGSLVLLLGLVLAPSAIAAPKDDDGPVHVNKGAQNNPEVITHLANPGATPPKKTGGLGGKDGRAGGRVSGGLDCDPSIDSPCDAQHPNHCFWQTMTQQPASDADLLNIPGSGNGDGAAAPVGGWKGNKQMLQIRSCSLPSGGQPALTRWATPGEAAAPPPPPDPAVLAAEVYSRMDLPGPGVHRSPKPDITDARTGLPYTYVNLATWYWVEPEAWSPRTDSTSLRGVTVTVTARPSALTYTPGDGGDAVTCDAAPGRPWTKADGDDIPADACAYVYQDVQADGITARTAITWTVTWTSTGAVVDSGQLDPPVEVYTDTPPFLVKQIRTVLGKPGADGGGG